MWVLIENNFTLTIYTRFYILIACGPFDRSIRNLFDRVRFGRVVRRVVRIDCESRDPLFTNTLGIGERPNDGYRLLFIIRAPIWCYLSANSRDRDRSYLFGPRGLAIKIDPTYLVHETSRSRSILPIWFARPRAQIESTF